MKPKKPEAPKAVEKPVAEPIAEAPKRGIFKQPLTKPQPWQFGGRGARTDVTGGDKPAPDAERRGGKSRKVH